MKVSGSSSSRAPTAIATRSTPRGWPAPSRARCGTSRPTSRRRRGHPAGRLRLRRLPARRRDRPLQPDHGRRPRVRRARRAGARHLQRLPGAGRGGLVPGALLRNATLRFEPLGPPRGRAADTPFTRALAAGPDAAHADRPRRGQLLPAATTSSTRSSARAGPLPLRERDAAPERATRTASARDIAGVIDGRGRRGLMPHPERASEADARVGRRDASCARWSRAGAGRRGDRRPWSRHVGGVAMTVAERPSSRSIAGSA